MMAEPTPIKRRGMHWRGPFCGIVLLLTSMFGCTQVLLPVLPLVVFSPKAWRYWVDRWIAFWETLPVCLLDFFYGSTIQVSGDEILPTEPAIIIMNHRTRLDWFYFWSALYKMNPKLLITEKISLKSGLKKMPGAGWAMQCDNFIFLDRKPSDLQIIEKSVEYLSKVGPAYQTLLFPEGTDLSPFNREKSRTFAAENNLQDLEYLLQPRTKGLVQMFSSMKRNNFISAIYDVTVAYGDTIVASEIDFIKGNCPLDIRFHVRRHSLSDLPSVDDEIGLWCQKIWQRKDTMLRSFYEDPTPAAERSFFGRIQMIEYENPINSKDKDRGADKVWPSEYSGVRYACLWASLGLWLYAALIVPITLLCSSYYWIWFLFGVASYIYIQYAHNGVESWAIKCFLKSEKSE